MDATFTRREAIALSLCATLPRAAKAAVSVTDVMGRTIELPRLPERIGVAFYLEEFTAIAGRDGWQRVAGFRWHQWAVNRAKTFERFVSAVPRIGTLPDIGAGEEQSIIAEKAIAIRPDLLIIPPWALSTDAVQMQQIEAAGIPYIVVDYNAQTLEKHIVSTLAIGKVTGAEARANELAELYRSRIADIRERSARAKRHPSVYIEIGWLGAGEFGNTYKNTMWGKQVDSVGALNIANEAMPATSGFQPIAPEKILAAQPEYIFITGSSWANRPNAVKLGYDVDRKTALDSLRPYLSRNGWNTLPAVRNGRVYTVEHSLIRSLTDWISLEYIAKQFYPEHFTDIDPEASLRKFHERYLPVSYDGTWMTGLAS